MSREELKLVMQTAPRGKSLDSDGLPYEFYTVSWGLLWNALLAVVAEAFLGGGFLPASLRRGSTS